MAVNETARLERETEETRARLEQTLGELRARMSPGQLLDQASNYFRHNSGRAFLGNLRDEVVHNPVPVALVGAGVAWLALSGTLGRRHNGANGSVERDWGRTAGIAQDLSQGGDGPSTMQRGRETAEGLVGQARDAMSGGRESASDMSARASTAYDEAVGRAHQTASSWSETASSTAHQTRDKLREGMESARESASHIREHATDMYGRTASGLRSAAHRAAEYGRSARHTFDSDGALITFCRAHPLLVAGLGVAFGAALAAMIPATRPERQIMGDASRDLQDRARETGREVQGRVREAATQGLHAAMGENGQSRPDQSSDGADVSPYGSDLQRGSRPGEAGRGDSPMSGTTPREPWQSETYREAAADLERGVQQGDHASNVETEPRSTPFSEAAEAGAMGTPSSTEEDKQRT